MEIVNTLGMLFLTLGIGILLRKSDFLDDYTNRKLSSLLVNVTLPLLVISSVSGMEGGDSNVILVFFLGLLCYALYPLVGWLMVRILRVPPSLSGTFACFAVFSNNAFMGFPIVQALYGDSAIFFSNIFHLPFSITFYSFALHWMRKSALAGAMPEEDEEGDQDTLEPGLPRSSRSGEKKSKKSPAQRILAIRQILNNGMIAAILALAIYFLQIPVPDMIANTLRFVGNLSMPVSMIVLGSTMAGYKLKELIPGRSIVIFTLARLGLMPLITYGVLSLFIRDVDLVKTITITVGMPIATLVGMGASLYEEQGKEASVAVVFSTVCSIVSIPIMLAILV